MCALLGVLLVEILAVGLCKIPLRVLTYRDAHAFVRCGRSTSQDFTTYAYSMASLEVRVLDSRPQLVAFGVAICVAIGLATLARARFLRNSQGLRFEEEDPDAIFEGFKLSEGLAASAPARGD
ncbi:MAG: hypothetical protein LC753_10210 [Acidobacteria bacterium]|nr:hypothetical protein [Acidobacteriota bacterium]MCA1650627.1 hypothetical protein [Acidobacteriota bacterium]